MRCTFAAGPRGRISHAGCGAAGRAAAGRELQFSERALFSRFRRNCSDRVTGSFFRIAIAMSAF